MNDLKDLVQRLKIATESNDTEQVKSLGLQIVESLAKLFKPEAEEVVKAFEGGMETTKGNYGRYMQFLSNPQLKGMYFPGMVKALKNAGAGQGLDDAIRIVKGY
jgi:hypothetical protein